MGVERESVERVMRWLAEGGPVRAALPAAGVLAQTLAVLLFEGDAGWPENADRADSYRDVLDAWLAADGDSESRFAALTGPDADPGVFVDWFGPVLAAWRARPAGDGGGQGAGFANPGFDGTPGTEFYRVGQAGGYLYSASADGGDWATYEQRRYSPPARDESHGLEYRYDRTGGVYQWLDQATGTWQDQSWADAHAAARQPAGQTPTRPPEGGPRPEWDESWAMFYRVGPDGAYEFADALTPGERSSGCGRTWLRHDQVLARDTRRPRTEPEARATLESLFRKRPQLREGLTDDDIKAIIAEMTPEAFGG